MTALPNLRPFPIRWPHRRLRLKVLHFTMAPLALWFTFLDPGDPLPSTFFWVRFQSVLALIFVIGAVFWTLDAGWNGMASRPGPKLPPWARRVHWWMHRMLIGGFAIVALTGLGLGLTANRQLWAGGIVPIGVPLHLPEWNHLIGKIHKYEFYALSALIAAHALFHIWRHFHLRDNALRIMAPKRWHKYL